MLPRISIVTFVLLLKYLVSAQITPGPIVDTAYGQIQGNNVPMQDPAGVVYSFWNVPYAKPPVGNLRFEIPQNPDPWSGVRYNPSFGVACPQGRSIFILTQPAFNDFDEDCLYLNIFSADLEASNPVMVWFHGGAFVSGSGIQYPGYFLAQQGLVIVTVNYRLGNLGFLTTEDSVVPGNAGLYDQRQALLWVQENIAAFGGNPNSVTIFGQSAGAASTSLQVVSPLSQGLFHRAIMESGTDFSLWSINWPIQEPANYTRQVAEKFGCPTSDSRQMVDCLKTVPWQQLWNTTFECHPGTFCQGMAPVIDGPGGFIPDHPIYLREQGLINKVPIMTGFNREDGSLYTLALIPESLSGGFNRSEFERLLVDNLLSYFTAMFPPERHEDLFNIINWYYSPWPHIDDEYLNRAAFNFLLTDAAFGYPADSQAKHHSQYAPTYLYVFGFRSSNASRVIPEWMGVPHMCELPYVWGYPLLQLNPDARDDCRIIDALPYNQEDIDYARYFMSMIVNFAKTSDPTPTPIQPPTVDSAPISWPQYNGVYRDNLALDYLYVDNVNNAVLRDYRQHQYSLFTDHAVYFAGYPLTPPNSPIPPGSFESLFSKTKPSKGKRYLHLSEREKVSLESDWFVKAQEAFINELVLDY